MSARCRLTQLYALNHERRINRAEDIKSVEDADALALLEADLAALRLTQSHPST
jgi:hypothetical protein